MASFNKVMLMGNLTRDPELKNTASGATISRFGLAVNRKYKQGEDWKEDVCFVDITTWGNQAENCSKYLKKGSLVYIEGRLNFGSWEKDGERRNKLDVVASNIQFLDSKTLTGGPGGSGGSGGSGPPEPWTD